MTELVAGGALLLSGAIDLTYGEPKRFHPVIWMGNWVKWWSRRIPELPRSAFRKGLGMFVSGVFVVAGLGFSVGLLLSMAPKGLEIVLLAIALKPSFSIKALVDAARVVSRPLQDADLVESRLQLGRHLVSRPTAELKQHEIAGATIASLFENLTDSIVAPLFFYILFGLPGAYVYRFVNTADAMVGYRTEKWEYFGKATARVDDVLNWIPARISAALLFLVAGKWRGAAWKHAAEQALKTPSPNGGWTMGMGAILMGIQIEKRHVYCLNPSGREPAVDDIAKSVNLLKRAALLCLLLSTGATLV